MKIAVYTIALNEERHVARWHESAKEADLLLIADTGSTDKTKFIAKSLGITVHEIAVTPWRFDVARNASLALVPEDFDVCIQLDMDETLQPGWRKKVEAAFLAGNNWPIYKHVTSRTAEGEPKTYQHYFKIHPRRGFIWKYPIHEVLISQPGVVFDRQLIDLEVDHIQDQSKSRNSYLDLLEMAVKEEPNDWRMRHYLNREYWYKKDWNKVLSSAYEAMERSNGWDVERASTCMWASEAAHFLNLKKLSIEWADLGIREAPNFYEAWHWRAHLAHLHGDWQTCRESSFKRLELNKQDHHLVKPDVWEWWGYDLMALSSHRLGFNREAVTYGQLSLTFKPDDERLIRNLRFYEAALTKEKSLKHLNHLDSKDKNQIDLQLAFVFDDNYLYPFLIAIYSAALYSDETFSIIVGDAGVNLSDESREIITHTCEKLQINLNWCKISLESSFNRSLGHIAPITIGRLALMDVLPSPFVYVDVDLVFLHGWQKLLSEGDFLSGIVVKAVEDAIPTQLKKEWTSIGTNKAFNSERPYFNAGVLVVNPEVWREFEYSNKWRDLYFDKYDSLGFRFLDQDILNYLLAEKIVILPEQFNFQVTWGMSGQKNCRFPSKTSDLSLPFVLHFIGSAKPWRYSKKSRDSFFASKLTSVGKLDENINTSNIEWMSQYFWIEKLFWQWVQIQEHKFIEILNEIYSRVTKVDY